MKKLLLLICALGFLISCTPENFTNEDYATDKTKICPPSDRNCNGIPDNEE